jgi:nicotinamide-nucleotide amidase
VPGVSESFLCGVVTYSNEAKMKLLKVSENTLKLHGAVSRETAEEMALGVRKLSGTDIGISITGIAGPSGGTEEKPVGLCYIGTAYNEKVEAYRFVFNGSRNKIRWNANTKVLDILRRSLL